MTTKLQHFAQNTQGSDYVVGDIHGCFTKLKEKLEEIGFNKETDRLFSVGDLVDRGPESEDCLDWLEEPWFFAVRGNHEQMAIECSNGFFDPVTYKYNGGEWFMKLNQSLKWCYAEVFEELPIAIEIETKEGLVGIIHAECPVDDWADMSSSLDTKGDYFINECIWSRSRINYSNTSEVKNIDEVIVGHTPVDGIRTLGNVHYIDTGAVFGKDFTIVKIS